MKKSCLKPLPVRIWHWTNAAGFVLLVFFCSFIVIHVYLSSLGHTWWAHFEAMITGWEEVEDDEAEAANV